MMGCRLKGKGMLDVSIVKDSGCHYLDVSRRGCPGALSSRPYFPRSDACNEDNSDKL